MPNWCRNDIRIIGPAQRIAELTYLAALPVFGEVHRGDKVISPFARETLVGTPPDAERSPFRLNYIVPIPFNDVSGREYWGTKSDTADDGDEDNTECRITSASEPYGRLYQCDYSFSTAWSGPEFVMNDLSARFDGLGMRMSCVETGNGIYALLEYFNGFMGEKAVEIPEPPEEAEDDEGESYQRAIDQAFDEVHAASDATSFERVKDHISKEFGGWDAWDGDVWPTSLRELNELGPEKLSAGLRALAGCAREQVDSYLSQLRQPSSFGVLDAVLMTRMEIGQPTRLDFSRVLQLAACCAEDDELARVVGSEQGRLMNGIHSAAYLARAALPNSIEARGVKNIFRQATFHLDPRFAQLIQKSKPDERAIPNDQVGRVLTTGALAASGNPDAWGFLRKASHDTQIQDSLFMSASITDTADLDAAVAYFGVREVISEADRQNASAEIKVKLAALERAELLSTVFVAPSGEALRPLAVNPLRNATV
jgi:hypothetical protein